MIAVEITDLPDYVFPQKRRRGNDQNAVPHDRHAALALHEGNRTHTAKHLGISRVTLWKKLKEFGID